MMSMDVVIMPTDGHPIFDTTNNQRINQIKSAVEIGKSMGRYGGFYREKHKNSR